MTSQVRKKRGDDGSAVLGIGDVEKFMQTVLVAAGVVIEEKRVLLDRRRGNAHLGGMWEFPGGKVEPGEDPRQTVVRELMEEIGIRVRVGEIIDVTFHQYEDAKKAVILLFFEAFRIDENEEPQTIDVAEVKWFRASELTSLTFPPADNAVLRKVEERLRA